MPFAYLHELCYKEHAASLQASTIELHNVAVVQLGQGLDLLQEQLKLLTTGAVRLWDTSDYSHQTSSL